ncbi:unnamed protein product [Hymenolepis diminuta]|uniref:Uncharacterized protein n=1 Tax=Hymenolepis diminuta TaxID=6216 RepID=A0A564Y9W7_HYMDI|nr:unnamed protein product [Hymenolepis diminuta]
MSVYVVGRGEYVESTEVLGVEAGGQWTSLAYFDLTPDKRLHVDAMARVGNQNCRGSLTQCPFLRGRRVATVKEEESVNVFAHFCLTTDGQWSSLTSNDCSLCQPLRVGSMTGVNNLLFIADYDSSSVYSIELESDLEHQDTKFGEMKEIWKDTTYVLLTTIQLK